MRDGDHGEGAGVGIPASKGERELEYIHRGDQSRTGTVSLVSNESPRGGCEPETGRDRSI